MNTIFLSTHNDDETLFGAFTLIREKPMVVIITDSWIQPNRGEVGCDAETRWQESKKAMEILGCMVTRVGIRDYDLKMGNLANFLLNTFGGRVDKIYAPALQGGNPHHDMVSEAAKIAFGDKVIYYSSYASGEFFTKGDIEIRPTQTERELKNKALECYVSQINLASTKGHFEAVKDQSEYLIK